MGCSDNLVLVFLVLSSLLPSVKLDDTAGSYNWMISLAELRKEESNGNSELRVIQDVSCNSKECKNIYARIRAVHEAHVSTFSKNGDFEFVLQCICYKATSLPYLGYNQCNVFFFWLRKMVSITKLLNTQWHFNIF